MKKITFEDIKNNEEINVYINKGNELLGVLGYTDHSAAHTMKVADTAAEILTKLGYGERTIELSLIASYIHDIGNMINRNEHAQTGSIIAFNLLRDMGMDPVETADIVAAVGNHDEDCGVPISPISAALIIADKTDVRRSRVRNNDRLTFDIHDRVNYAVIKTLLRVDAEEKSITLSIITDNTISSVMDYFEIFLSRMLMCTRAAEYLKTSFHLIINDARIL
jgi:metal-dependent HD superfamily phosphatase/phosphodiesterase